MMFCNSFDFSIVFLLTLTTVSLSYQNTADILCRDCGVELSSNKYIATKKSPKSYYSFNDTLFDKDQVLVQVLQTDFFFYPVVAFYHSNCVGVGEWEASTSWYPGYRWKACICAECGAHVGWVFEPIYPALVEPPKTFHSLILNSLISETCNYIIGDIFVG